MPKHELILFGEVAVALAEKAFGDDLALIVSENPDKATINRIAGETAEIISLSGDYDPLREIITIKRLIAYLDEIENLIRPAATTEAQKYTGGGKLKNFEKSGAKVSIKKNPSEWDFSHCDAITRRETQIKNLKAQIKAIQDQLKITSFIDPETGAEYEPAVKVIEGQENISITL